jgi:hypothetical protein
MMVQPGFTGVVHIIEWIEVAIVALALDINVPFKSRSSATRVRVRVHAVGIYLLSISKEPWGYATYPTLT